MARNDHSDIPELLDRLPCEKLSEQEWALIGMACKNLGLGFEVWDRWSAKDANRYKPHECKQYWNGWNVMPEGEGKGAGYIVKVCREHGIDTTTPAHGAPKPDREKPVPDRKKPRAEADPETVELHRRLIKAAADALRTDERARELAADYLGANVGITVEQAVERGIGVITPQVLKGFEGERRITRNYYYGQKFGCRYWLLFPMVDGYHVDRDIDVGWRERSTDEYKNAHDGYHKATKLSGMKQPKVCNPSALKADVCFIAEGWPDTLAVESHGYHATPLLSTSNRGTLDALRKAGKRVVVMTDNDKAGRDAAKRIAKDLKGACPCVVFDWPEGAPKDVGEWNATDREGLRTALEDVHRRAMEAETVENGSDDEGRRLFRGGYGRLLTNAIAKEIIGAYHARIIDGAPAVWTGRHWEFGKSAVDRCTLDIVDDAKSHDRNEVFNYIALRAPRVSSDKDFDGGYYVQFADATWDVLGGKTVKPTPDMFIIGTLDAAIGGSAQPNAADEFLKSVSGGDKQVIQALAEVIGACICSRLCAAQAPMLIGRAGGGKGKASNGKSTFINWVRAMLGTSNVSSLDISTLGQRFQAGQIVGKMANLGDDIPNDFIKGGQLATFKKLVSGDTVFTDVKGATGFDFKPSATLVFSMNDIPNMGDSSEGVMRRLAFIPFRRRFTPGEEGFDPHIARKLARPEVLTRGAMLGVMALPDLIDRGRFTEISGMAQELEELKRDNDSVEEWLYTEGITDKDVDGVPTAEVHARYSEYCGNHSRRPVGHSAFTRKILESDYFPYTVSKKQKRFGDRNLQAFFIEPDR